MSEVSVTETVTKTYKANRRLYQNRDKSALVDENDPQASFLLAAEGGEVSAEDVEKYGLLGEVEAEGAGADKNASEGKTEPQAGDSEDVSGMKRETPEPKVIGSVDNKPKVTKSGKKASKR